MSYSTSDHVLHPESPALGKETNTPREPGQTRVLPDGSLVYLNPMTDTEVPAVRLHDIRPRLVAEASTKLSYRFPKKRGYEDTNVTAFVKKDYNFGPARDNRPDRLFQIQSNGDNKGEKPKGYVMNEGRVVLDAFDHGLRDFGTQLPIYVSSELEGQDIEDYLRRNWEITLYDLIARAPNGYWTGDPAKENKSTGKNKTAKGFHEGPPRVGTFSMRATRFRQSAGLISWSLKDGSAPKNQRILDLIPAEFKDPSVNSIKGWRDLDAAEIKTIQAGHKKTPQKARKKNRAAKAEKELANAETITDSVEEEVDPDGLTSSHEENGIYTQDDDEESPLGTYQVHRMSSIHDGQQENSPAVPVQFAPNEDTNSMQTRYHDPPIHCKQEKLTQPKTTEKRKRTGNNTTKHVEGQRSTKRTLMPTPILALPPPALILPSQHEQLETQNTGFPPTRTDETESFLNELYRYADEEICEEEDTQIEDPGQMQRVDEQYEDSEHMNSPLYWPLVEQPEQMLRVTHQYADPERVRAPHYWP